MNALNVFDEMRKNGVFGVPPDRVGRGRPIGGVTISLSRYIGKSPDCIGCVHLFGRTQRTTTGRVRPIGPVTILGLVKYRLIG